MSVPTAEASLQPAKTFGEFELIDWSATTKRASCCLLLHQKHTGRIRSVCINLVGLWLGATLLNKELQLGVGPRFAILRS